MLNGDDNDINNNEHLDITDYGINTILGIHTCHLLMVSAQKPYKVFTLLIRELRYREVK